MNLTLHQFCKDCVRLRVPIGLWLLLILLQALLIIPGIAEPGEDLTLQIIFKILSNLVPILQMLLPLIIVPLLIHEEPMVGTTAFWFTRPIDGTMLLASKMLFLVAILVMLPLLTELIILGFHGASIRELFLATPEILFEQLNFLAYVVVIAALTQTFARFALVGASLFIGYYVLSFVVMIVFWYLDTPSFLKGWNRPHLEDSRYVVSTVAFIAIIGVLLVNLYRKRESRRAWLVAGIALIFSFLLNSYWDWDFLKHGVTRRESGYNVAALKLDISIDPYVRQVSDSLRYRPQEEAKKTISAPLRISGLPEGHVAEPTKIKSSLKFPDGNILEHADYVISYFSREWNPKVVQQVLGASKILNPEKEAAIVPKLLSVSDEVFAKYASVPGTLSAELEFSIKRYEAVVEMPVRPKARYDRGSEHAVITHVLKQTGGSTVLLRESKISLFFGAENNKFGPYFDLFARPTVYILRNSKRGEALWPNETPGPGFDLADLFFQKRLRTLPLALRYSALTEQGGKLTEFDDGWLADAMLVRIEEKEIGRVTRTLHVDAFVMGKR